MKLIAMNELFVFVHEIGKMFVFGAIQFTKIHVLAQKNCYK